jgi:hypothetical protein
MKPTPTQALSLDSVHGVAGLLHACRPCTTGTTHTTVNNQEHSNSRQARYRLSGLESCATTTITHHYHHPATTITITAACAALSG